MKLSLFIALFGLWFAVVAPVFAEVSGLQAFPGSTLVPADWADGDSFPVRLGGSGDEITVRLYFVDCPEAAAERESDWRRILEQSRHFGVPNPAATYQAGIQARQRTAALLASPFTVYTAFADAMGRSGYSRVYAFVTLEDGSDLGEVLVREGLARAYGVGRATPDGVPADEYRARLEDISLTAALGRAGLWAATEPGMLVDLRAAARAEDRMLREVASAAGPRSLPGEPVDINRAPHAELMLLPGVGEVLADRILDGRPYRSVEDLLRVHGIGAATLERMRPYVTVTPPAQP